MSDDPYLIPGTQVLVNRLNITNAKDLDQAERLLVVQRRIEGPPTENFDLNHLQAIHYHLFQDVYEWAGQLRTVEINKGGSQFQFRQFIQTGMADIHRRLGKKKFLSELSADDFATEVADILSDVNFVHPFREGNGRAQLEYLRQLGLRAGHDINPDNLDPNTWQTASKAAFDGSNLEMAKAILSQVTSRKLDDPTKPKDSDISKMARYLANRIDGYER